MAITMALLDANWVNEPNRYNPATEKFGSTPDPTRFLPAGCKYWQVETKYALESYLAVMAEWLKKHNEKLKRLILASHGNSGQLFLGRGLKLENAGMFQVLKGHFDMAGPAQRVVNLYGCGVASDTGVELSELNKDPKKWPEWIRGAVSDPSPLQKGDSVRFQVNGVAYVIVSGRQELT